MGDRQGNRHHGAVGHVSRGHGAGRMTGRSVAGTNRTPLDSAKAGSLLNPDVRASLSPEPETRLWHWARTGFLLQVRGWPGTGR